ncbi:hypothetical protein PHYPSEUDO_006406 [Phytophthora pseudosyringae]|uniref:TKL protein kinase n=1 Tax=Phytophthora pseudosyringae TaxID=221518 RepID=A0A8T1WA92_9STRA|nr:hypothetical protein PHYPSEUDO_006406 [Phytophthora pseudosyringae]
MLRCWTVALVGLFTWRSATSTLMKSSVVYTDAQCEGTPTYVFLVEDAHCATERTACNSNSDGGAGNAQYVFTTCVDTARHDYVADVFQGFSYVMLDLFQDDECTSLSYAQAFLAAGICQRAGSGNDSISSIVRLQSNGSARLQLFEGPTCGGEPSATLRPTASDIAKHTCVGKTGRFYSSARSPSNTSSSSSSTDSSLSSSTEPPGASAGLSTAGIVALVAGSVALALLFVLALFIWRQRSPSTAFEDAASPVDLQAKLNPSYSSDTTERGTMADVHAPRGSSILNRENSAVGALWDDEAIVAVRIPRSKVLVHERISRDGYAEVFKGTFNGQLVTVKSLVPQTRQNIEQTLIALDVGTESIQSTNMNNSRNS